MLDTASLLEKFNIDFRICILCSKDSLSGIQPFLKKINSGMEEWIRNQISHGFPRKTALLTPTLAP